MNPRMFIQTMITLASASLGLVADLAWNEAIKATIKAVFHTGESLTGLFICAVLAVAVLIYLARTSSRIGGESAFIREAGG